MTKNTRTSTKQLVKEAAAGSESAALALGLLYELGLEEKPDVAKAKIFYLQAAEKGNNLARNSAFQIVKTGSDGSKPNLKAAETMLVELVQIAAKQTSEKTPDLKKGINPAMKVLVIDISENDRQSLDMALTLAGYSLIFAQSGTDALKVIKENPDIKMVFTEVDLGSENIDGVGITEKIRSTRAIASIPVVFITAVKDPGVITRAKKAGINGWILKPFNGQTVVSSANRWVRNIAS